MEVKKSPELLTQELSQLARQHELKTKFPAQCKVDVFGPKPNGFFSSRPRIARIYLTTEWSSRTVVKVDVLIYGSQNKNKIVGIVEKFCKENNLPSRAEIRP